MSRKCLNKATLNPGQALLTPAWLLSLSAMALNDHVLKGAGLLPDALTGKLSDIAGMMVAPSLLAVLTGTKTTRGLLACHAAVAAVFAGINVSHGFANLWSNVMGLVGMPWSITTDPTDLLVLPLMPLCWALTVPAMRKGYRAWHDASVVGPAARHALTGLGALACIATSPPDDGWEGEVFYEDIQADVYIHNSNIDQSLTVRVRHLKQDVELDCTDVVQNPGKYLQAPVFGEAFTWTMPPETTAAVYPSAPPARECHAVLLESDVMEPAVVFWRSDNIYRSSVPGQITSANQYTGGAVIADFGDEGELGTFSGYTSPTIVFPQTGIDEETDPLCERVDPGNRLAWSVPPAGSRELIEVEAGLDGCYAIKTALPGQEPDANPFYLCLPEIEFPFVAGDIVGISTLHALSIDLQSRDGVPVEEGGELSLHVATGSPSYNLRGMQISSVTEQSCAPVPEDECGTVAGKVNVFARYLGADQTDLTLGVNGEVVGNDGNTATVHVTYAEDFAVTHSSCYQGPDAPATEIEFAAVMRGPLAP